MFLVAKSFRLEKKGRGIGRDELDLEVVLGVGGEWRTVVAPKKLEKSKGLVVEAMAWVQVPVCYLLVLDKKTQLFLSKLRFFILAVLLDWIRGEMNVKADSAL